MPKFTRPKKLKFPQIYAVFEGRDKNAEFLVDYIIQELPEEYFDEALDLLISAHVPDETLHTCRGIEGNLDAIEDAREFWRKKLQAGLSIACFKNNDSELIGLNVLGVVSIDDKVCESGTNPEFKDVAGAFDYIASLYNVFDAYAVDKFLTDYGLVISRNYRQRGIATEFLKCRRAILKGLQLQVTSTTFTASASQKAAQNAGLKERFSISLSDLGEVFPNFDFSIASTEFVKIMDLEL